MVTRLMTNAGLLDQGSHFGQLFHFTKTFFFYLFQAQTSPTGTVYANRRGLPVSVVKAKLKNKEVC